LIAAGNGEAAAFLRLRQRVLASENEQTDAPAAVEALAIPRLVIPVGGQRRGFQVVVEEVIGRIPVADAPGHEEVAVCPGRRLEERGAFLEIGRH